MNKPDLSEFFALIAEEKKKAADEKALQEEKKRLKSEKIKEDFLSLISDGPKKEPVVEPIVEEKTSVVEEDKTAPTLQEKTVQYIQDEKKPEEKTELNEQVVQRQISDLKNHINQLALGLQGLGGGGEVNLRWLDDVDRSSIADGRWLKYNLSLIHI